MTGSTTNRSADLHAPGAVAVRLSAGFGALDLSERLAAICNEVSGAIIFTTSFGIEDQAIVTFERQETILKAALTERAPFIKRGANT
jgi:hypothetical protein